MPTTDDFGQEIDTSVVNLARAIRKKESGGNYNAKGKSGEFGAFQWMPGNFEAAAKKYGLDPTDKSPVNQDKVAYYSLLEGKKAGLTPEQIAAKWNSGSPTGWENKRGVNKYGAEYDVPKYVQEVMANFQKEKIASQGEFTPPQGGMRFAGGAGIAEASDGGLPQQEQQEYDDTELELMRYAGIDPNRPQTLAAPYTFTDLFNDFAVGVSKQQLKTATNIGSVITPKSVLNIFSPLLAAALPNKSFTELARDNIPGFSKLTSEENLKAKSGAERAGQIAEQTAEFIAPMKLVRGGQLAIDAMIKGTGFMSAAGRVASKAALEGAAGGTVALAQTGDPKEAVKTGAFFGALKGVTGAAGEAARAFNLPERIYSSIFKNSYKDVVQQLKTMGAKNFQREFPEEFKNLVAEGIIKTGKNGVIEINETLAKEALDRGLKGSLKNMSNQAVAGLYRSESKVRAAAKAAKTPVDVSEKQYLTILRQIQADYKDVGFGEFSQKAKLLADAIKKGKGKISAEDAVAVRRLLDGLRVQTSYNNPTRLSLSQQNLRFLSNALRARVNKVPGMEAAMKDYVFYIDAFEHIAKEAARTGNRQIISLLDSVLFGGGAVAATPAYGAALTIGRRVLTTPASATRIAQGIQNSGAVTKTGALIKGLITSLRPFQGDQ